MAFRTYLFLPEQHYPRLYCISKHFSDFYIDIYAHLIMDHQKPKMSSRDDQMTGCSTILLFPAVFPEGHLDQRRPWKVRNGRPYIESLKYVRTRSLTVRPWKMGGCKKKTIFLLGKVTFRGVMLNFGEVGLCIFVRHHWKSTFSCVLVGLELKLLFVGIGSWLVVRPSRAEFFIFFVGYWVDGRCINSIMWCFFFCVLDFRCWDLCFLKYMT